MTMALDHLKVSSHNRWAAAELLAQVLEVPWPANGVVGSWLSAGAARLHRLSQPVQQVHRVAPGYAGIGDALAVL